MDKLESSDRYLSNKLIASYNKITRLHTEIAAKDDDLSYKNNLCIKHIKFVHNLADVVANGGIINRSLLLILIKEHGLLDGD